MPHLYNHPSALIPVTRIAQSSQESKRRRKSRERKFLVLRGKLPEYTSLQELPDEASDRREVTPASLLEVDSSIPEVLAMASAPEDYCGLVLQCICPGCTKETMLSYSRPCANRSKKSGRICGYALPRAVSDCNSDMKSKIEKRVVPPTGVFSGLVSHNQSPDFYLYGRELLLASGNLYFEPSNRRFMLYCAPSGATEIAVVFSGSTGTSYSASGFGMFLNQKPQELHPYFGNLSPDAELVGPVKNAILEYPFTQSSNLYRWQVSGLVAASWDSQFNPGPLPVV